MILRHPRESIDDQPAENSFEAIDERSGARLASCTIYLCESDQLFPNRPMRVYLDIEGESAPDALLGAAVARAKELAIESGMPARVFTQVEPDDSQLMEALKILGFKDTDGLVRLRRELPAGAFEAPPISCVVVRDTLDDPIEQKYFLERYNQLYGEDYDFEWLHDLREKKGFERILLVAPTGMAGEIIIWQKDGIGEIGWLFTSKKWRKLGIAQRLLELACERFSQDKLRYAEAEIQARIPSILRCVERFGFRQHELILRYPGIDIG